MTVWFAQGYSLLKSDETGLGGSGEEEGTQEESPWEWTALGRSGQLLWKAALSEGTPGFGQEKKTLSLNMNWLSFRISLLPPFVSHRGRDMCEFNTRGQRVRESALFCKASWRCCCRWWQCCHIWPYPLPGQRRRDPVTSERTAMSLCHNSHSSPLLLRIADTWVLRPRHLYNFIRNLTPHYTFTSAIW